MIGSVSHVKTETPTSIRQDKEVMYRRVGRPVRNEKKDFEKEAILQVFASRVTASQSLMWC